MLASQLSSVEEALCEVLAEENSGTRNNIEKLQGLDFIRQSLEDCALMFLLISRKPELDETGHLNVEEITSRLKLESTRAILSAAPKQTRRSLGNVQLF